MPTVKGNLLFVSSRAAQVSEVWVRAPRVRTHLEGVVTTGNDRFPVTGGEVSFTAVPGPAVLALISQGRAVDTIPILVGDGATQTLRQVVSAAKVADDATKREIEKLAAQAVELVDSSVTNAKKAQDGATRAETAAGNAKKSETSAEDAARRASNSSTSANRSSVWVSEAEQRTEKSASAAAESASQAAGSASSAKSDADRAASIASSTSWSGDKLTVNGKTSPSLTGPKGDTGPSGATTWDRISGKPDITPYLRNGSIVQRDENGRAYIAEPRNVLDIANKGYVDTAVAAEKARTVGMVWMVETESAAQAKESSCQKGDFIQVAQTGNIYQVV